MYPVNSNSPSSHPHCPGDPHSTSSSMNVTIACTPSDWSHTVFILWWLPRLLFLKHTLKCFTEMKSQWAQICRFFHLAVHRPPVRTFAYECLHPHSYHLPHAPWRAVESCTACVSPVPTVGVRLFLISLLSNLQSMASVSIITKGFS